MEKTPEAIPAPASSLGEGPVWDSRTQSIIWVDIIQGIIHEYHPESQHYRSIATGEMIGTVALGEDGNFMAALHHGFTFINRETGALKRIFDPEKEIPGNRFNDGKCDAAGRFWAGTMSLDEQTLSGALYRLDPDLAVHKMITGVTISNGLAWSGNRKTFYFIDSPTRQVMAYDYDLLSGNLSNPRVAIQIPEEEGFPDGMTIDVADKLWIAQWGGWQVARWDPDSGKKLFQFDLPVAKVTSCVFGGPQLQDIYITTASIGLDDTERKEQPLAGCLFVCKNCGYLGLEGARYKFTGDGSDLFP